MYKNVNYNDKNLVQTKQEQTLRRFFSEVLIETRIAPNIKRELLVLEKLGVKKEELDKLKQEYELRPFLAKKRAKALVDENIEACFRRISNAFDNIDIKLRLEYLANLIKEDLEKTERTFVEMIKNYDTLGLLQKYFERANAIPNKEEKDRVLTRLVSLSQEMQVAMRKKGYLCANFHKGVIGWGILPGKEEARIDVEIRETIFWWGSEQAYLYRLNELCECVEGILKEIKKDKEKIKEAEDVIRKVKIKFEEQNKKMMKPKMFSRTVEQIERLAKIMKAAQEIEEKIDFIVQKTWNFGYKEDGIKTRTLRREGWIQKMLIEWGKKYNYNANIEEIEEKGKNDPGVLVSGYKDLMHNRAIEINNLYEFEHIPHRKSLQEIRQKIYEIKDLRNRILSDLSDLKYRI